MQPLWGAFIFSYPAFLLATYNALMHNVSCHGVLFKCTASYFMEWQDGLKAPIKGTIKQRKPTPPREVMQMSFLMVYFKSGGLRRKLHNVLPHSNWRDNILFQIIWWFPAQFIWATPFQHQEVLEFPSEHRQEWKYLDLKTELQIKQSLCSVSEVGLRITGYSSTHNILSRLHVDFVNQLKGTLSLQWCNYSSSITCLLITLLLQLPGWMKEFHLFLLVDLCMIVIWFW